MDWMITALVLSLLGSVHCMGMCGGYAMLAHTGTSAPKNASFSVYLFGKTVSYIAIGAVLGMIGEGLHGVPFGARMLSLLTGLFMILVGLHMAGVHALTRFVTPRSSGTLVGWLSRSVSTDGLSNRFVLGLLNGLLPCGLLYAAFAGAASRGSFVEGGLFMLMFSLGTFPSLYVAARLFGAFSGSTKLTLARLSGGLVVLFGILTMLRGSAFLRALMS